MKCRTYSLIASGLLLLAACSSAPVVPPIDSAARERQALGAIESGDLLAARGIYQELVQRTTGGERTRFQIALAQTDIELGDAEGALALLAAINPPLSPALESALTAARASALFALGQTVEAVRLLIEREIWLESSGDILDNQARIWDGLALPVSQPASGTRTGDLTIDGWLALAPLTRLSNDGTEFLAALISWREEFGNHPAAAGILAERLAAVRGAGLVPAKMALLLPLSSDARAQALAIRDGFYAAHFANGKTESTAIEILDTTVRGSVEGYLAAQLQGADFIVGPLLANEVERVQLQAGFVPTLALNVSAAAPLGASNFFQFSLSSDDEIEAIATHAINAGHTTAVILHASTDRGYRLMNSFSAAFEARGGRIIDSAAYAGNLSAPIEDLLNITESEQRQRQLQQTLGLPIQFEPRRRTDIDMVFLQAEPGNARLLVPLLAGSNAADIPTYATSEVYDPARPGNDNDLDGLFFPDLPLLINPVGEARVAADLLAEFSSESAAQYRRLFAFGFDAYELALALYAGGSATWPLAGATGELYLDSSGRIRRILPFAEMRDGQPEATLPAIGLFGAR